jgi:DNA-binding LacI/PurR family transcriptional regulator
MAEQACELLIERISSGDLSPRRILLPTKLVVRESCGAKLGPAIRLPDS